MSERQIELTWTCSSCRTRNLGRHMACQGCGNPKDDSEEYEMPADPSQVASVTDPELLRMAKAGANWRCAYCGSDQRDLHGGCMQCGAGRKEGANVRTGAGARPGPGARSFARSRVAPFAAVAGLAAVVVIAIGVFVATMRRPKPPPIDPLTGSTSTAAIVSSPRTEFDAEVTEASWRRVIAIETWALVPHEGFTESVPQGAVDVRSAGQREHHREDVFDHDETVYDDVEVPDGYRTETYTERVSCGQDCKTSPRVCRPVCTSTPKSCSQRCTNNKNGFATCTTSCTGGTTSCRDDCSGGTTTCTTKYCDEPRTRQVPKTRHEKRPRVVKKYRSEPRFAPWSTYKTWEWKPTATFEAHGDDAAPRWPDVALDGGARLVLADASATPKPGDRREVKSETLSVTLRTDDGRSHVHVPASEEELAKLAPGTSHKVKVEGASLKILD